MIYQMIIILENAREVEDWIAVYWFNSVKLRINVEKKVIVIKSPKLKQIHKRKMQSIYLQLH